MLQIVIGIPTMDIDETQKATGRNTVNQQIVGCWLLSPITNQYLTMSCIQFMNLQWASPT